MIPKSGHRFSEKIMRHERPRAGHQVIESQSSSAPRRKAMSTFETMTRRRLLRAAGAVAGGAALPAPFVKRAAAAEQITVRSEERRVGKECRRALGAGGC